MRSVDQFTCLVVPPVSSSSALRQAARLAAAGETSSETAPILHVLLFRKSGRAPSADAVRAEIEAIAPTLSLRTHVRSRRPTRLRDEVHRGRSKSREGLLVADSTVLGDARSLPEELLVRLVDEGENLLYIVDEARPLAAIETVLVPTSLSQESLPQLRYATELAAVCDASVVVLHVADTDPYVALTPVDRLSLGQTPLPVYRARRRLQQVREEGRLPDVSIQTRIVFGTLPERIAHLATEEEGDAVVWKRDEPWSPLLRSVSDRRFRRPGCHFLFVQ